MSEHLPECDHFASRVTRWTCICPELRFCEQRVLDDDVLAASYHGQKGYEVGYRKGLDVARKAVAALDACPECSVDAALAAINALQVGDHSGPRQPSGYSPTATDNRP